MSGSGCWCPTLKFNVQFEPAASHAIVRDFSSKGPRQATELGAVRARRGCQWPLRVKNPAEDRVVQMICACRFGL